MSETAVAAQTFLARIHVTLKEAVVDPQGDTILSALQQLHFATTQRVRMGKYLEIRFTAPDEQSAHDLVEAMCSTLLANPVIERYAYSVEAAQA